ncbi:gluconolactonase (plasmid) [Aestuarium zhoushanense]|nr:gluconolactonase [Aestuarium zhoushanense]
MSATVFDSRNSILGEGPLWHPFRKQLFWFDIIGKKLLSRIENTELEWQFDEHVSAAGWIDHDSLLIASETGLWHFAIPTGERELIVPLEADNPITRSNDGRADRQGGFWIGTMGKNAEPNAGAIYRFFKGELVKLFDNITIPNSICFSPNGDRAYFACTLTQKIMQVLLDPDGWPIGEPQVFIDLAPEDLYPDGSIVDGDGCILNAQWGEGRVARYSPNGSLIEFYPVAGVHSSCPAFGGHDFHTVFVTSACEGLDEPSLDQGRTYQISINSQGMAEPAVELLVPISHRP